MRLKNLICVDNVPYSTMIEAHEWVNMGRPLVEEELDKLYERRENGNFRKNDGCISGN